MRMLHRLVLTVAALLALFLLTATPGIAVLPDEVLDDPVLEARARVISKDIRCMVCQNQSIDDSNADLARDLRIIVRERLVAGDSDAEVKNYLVARYGDYVLLTPPMTWGTALLWGGPFVLLAFGSILIFFWYRGRGTETTGPVADTESGGSKSDGLSVEENRRLRQLMAEDDPSGRGSA